MNWSGRRVVVTGADGFIGSHLTERLVAEGADVTALCVYNSNGSHGWLDERVASGEPGLTPVLGDIRDAEFVSRLVDGAEYVFHLAALIAIPYSYVAPRSFVETNVVGTLNVLEAARRHSGLRVINTSTSEVYGTPLTTPITETHRVHGQSPYAASKVAADQLTLSYACSFEIDACTLRPFNTFGPRQSQRAVIPTILAQMLSGAETIRLGSLHPRRDFTFVHDTVEGFLAMAASDVSGGEVVQLGTGVSVSVGEVVEMCAKVTGSTARIVTDDERARPEASEVQVLLSDPTVAAQRIGWTPLTSLESGLEQTADWIRSIDLRRAAHFQR